MILRSALLYAALMLGANTGLAEATEVAPDLAALKTGAMKVLVVHPEPKPVPDVAFYDPDGTAHQLADWQGKVVILNFWATFCVPCREEMPALEALAADLGEDAVFLPVSIRSRDVQIRKFFEAIGTEDLPVYFDKGLALSGKMAVAGLPVVALINREGQEVARVTGPADWASAEARAVIEALIAE